MKKLLIMFGKTLGLASAITLFAAVSSANAVVIDFTRASLGDINTTPSGSDGGIGWTLSVVVGGNLNNSQLVDGSTCGSLGLACQRDGIGINDLSGLIDDEISVVATGGPAEVLKLQFDKAVNVSQLMFLDLFAIPGETAEQASVGTDGSTYPLTFVGTEGTGTSGALLVDVLGLTNITALYFTAVLPNLDDLTNDYALAGVNVSAVPLPASLPLFASGLGVLGYARWRKRKKAKRG